jgi:hypothetical protein
MDYPRIIKKKQLQIACNKPVLDGLVQFSKGIHPLCKISLTIAPLTHHHRHADRTKRQPCHRGSP